MSGSRSGRARGLLCLAGAGLVAGLASGQPELAVLAVPFLVLVGIGLVAGSQPHLSVTVKLERDRMLEGEATAATITVRNHATEPVDLDLFVEHSRRAIVDPTGPFTLRLARTGSLTIALSLRPERWGAHAIGPVTIEARDRLGVRSWRARLGQQSTVRVFPREQRLRELVAPLRTQPFLGTHVAAARGDGIEFADIRPFAPGDRVRQINWRATARRDALYMTERHPEHASDVVLLLDTFEEARERASCTLDAAVRASASLAREHLAQRDRVALVDFGGTLHWLEPAFGTTQLYRIIDALITSEIAFSYAWRAVESIPRKVLPPAALILAVSPLLDERSIRLITDLRRQGSDVTVIEVSPLTHVSKGARPTDALAYRLWRLQREALRARLQALGIGIAVWDDDHALSPALEGVNSFRRSAQQVAPG